MPEPVVLVIAGVILIDLLALEVKHLFERRQYLEGMRQSVKPENSRSRELKVKVTLAVKVPLARSME